MAMDNDQHRFIEPDPRPRTLHARLKHRPVCCAKKILLRNTLPLQSYNQNNPESV